MSLVWRKLQRSNKKAAKFRFTADLQELLLECDETWQPHNVSCLSDWTWLSGISVLTLQSVRNLHYPNSSCASPGCTVVVGTKRARIAGSRPWRTRTRGTLCGRRWRTGRSWLSILRCIEELRVCNGMIRLADWLIDWLIDHTGMDLRRRRSSP